MKIIAFIAAILSAATVATLAFTTVPAVQKQAADNAAAIEQNAEDISSVHNSVDGLNTRVETLENKKIYNHFITISNGINNIQSGSYFVSFFLISDIEVVTIDNISTVFEGIDNREHSIFANGSYAMGVDTGFSIQSVFFANNLLYGVRAIYANASETILPLTNAIITDRVIIN